MERVAEVTDRHILVSQSGDGVPLQLRPGYDDDEVQVVIDRGGVGVSVNVRVADLRHGLDLVEVMA